MKFWIHLFEFTFFWGGKGSSVFHPPSETSVGPCCVFSHCCGRTEEHWQQMLEMLGEAPPRRDCQELAPDFHDHNLGWIARWLNIWDFTGMWWDLMGFNGGCRHSKVQQPWHSFHGWNWNSGAGVPSFVAHPTQTIWSGLKHCARIPLFGTPSAFGLMWFCIYIYFSQDGSTFQPLENKLKWHGTLVEIIKTPGNSHFFWHSSPKLSTSTLDALLSR